MSSLLRLPVDAILVIDALGASETGLRHVCRVLFDIINPIRTVVCCHTGMRDHLPPSLLHLRTGNASPQKTKKTKTDPFPACALS